MAVKPYYQDDLITIYNADCREVIPELDPIDLVATDPPYGLNYNDGDLAHAWEKVFGGADEMKQSKPIANDGEEAHELFDMMLRLVKPKLKKGACCCCCCCCCGGGGPKPLFAKWSLMLDDIIGFKHAVVWDKGGLGMGIHFRRNYEFVLIGQNGSPAHRWNGGKTTANVWRIPKIIPAESDHPTPKPVQLMEKMVQLFTNAGDLVLDPFMGEGPTMVAAKNLNRRAVGIELEERYCETAALRLQQEVFALD